MLTIVSSLRKRATRIAVAGSLALAVSAASAFASPGGGRSGLSAGAGPSERGQSETVTLTLTEGTNLAAAVSPDNGTVVFDLQGGLYKMGAIGGKATRLTETARLAAYPDWSPDGKLIAFSSYLQSQDGSNFHIMVMRPDGSDVRRLTTGNSDNREPHFSPDGSKIAFASDRAGSYDIWVLDLGTGKLTQWTHSPGEEYQPVWAPSGDRIAYVADVAGTRARTIEATDAAGHTGVVVTEAEGAISAPSYSPSGDGVAYNLLAGNDSQLFISGQRVSNETEDVFPFRVEWLSSNEIIYTADGKIKKRNLTSGNVDIIPFEAQISFDRPTYHQATNRLDRQGGQVKGIIGPEISPDGSRVAFVALNDVWVMDIGKKPRRITHDQYNEMHAFWSPTGKYLAYTSDRDGIMRIYIRNMRTGKERKLALEGPVGAASQFRAAWCPDGDKIAFHTGAGHGISIYVADVSSGQVRLVSDSEDDPGRPTWGPGCEHLAYAALRSFSNRSRSLQGTNTIRVVDLATGDNYWSDPNPARHDSITSRVVGDGPVWSPNGAYMAFVREGVLWVMPVSPDGRPTGEPRQITDEVADYVSWTGDSRHLLYLSEARLRMVSVDGGHPRTIPLNLSWRTDVPSGLTVIRAGKLWDGTSPTVRDDVYILVRGDRILAILPAGGDAQQVSSLLKLPNVRYVDASELTVMPGLFEAHIHQDQTPADYLGARVGLELMSYGITSTMSMTDPVYRSLNKKESVLAGTMVAPRVFTSGETLNGSRVQFSDERATPNEEVLRRALHRLRALDVDLVKTYVRFPLELQIKAIQAAHDMGIPAFSHYFYPALAFGQDGITHLQAATRFGFGRTVSQAGRIYDDVIKLATATDMSITDTPFSQTTLAFHPEVLSDPRTRLLRTDWQQRDIEQTFERVTTTDQTADRERQRLSHEALARIQRAGRLVLVGTDSPDPPLGLGVHETLEIMVRFGNFSPYEALRAATVAPATRMGVAEDLGTVESGKIADMVFVKGDPLDDIAAAANVQKVMRGGHLYTLEELIAPFRSLRR